MISRWNWFDVSQSLRLKGLDRHGRGDRAGQMLMALDVLQYTYIVTQADGISCCSGPLESRVRVLLGVPAIVSLA